MPRDAPEVIVRGALRSGWDDTNTSNLRPTIHHGWVDTEYNEPEVTISTPNEDAVSGGDTGYSGMTNDGTPIRTMNGTLQVDVWANRTRTGNTNPRQYIHECKVEIERIIDANARVPTSTDIDFLSFVGARRQPEVDEEPTMYRYICSIGYGYRTQ